MDLIEWNVVERSCKPESEHEIKKGEEVIREDIERETFGMGEEREQERRDKREKRGEKGEGRRRERKREKK